LSDKVSQLKHKEKRCEQILALTTMPSSNAQRGLRKIGQCDKW